MSKTGKTPAQGLLVLGMHRSGTSALSRVLGLCGFDLGERVLGPGPGNETGHWEDAFAVDLHERLLAAHGAAWDDALVLPADWLQTEPGRDAVAGIAGYLQSSRARHLRWAVKDPRLCLFAPAWQAAAARVGQPLSAALVLRHPMEVAQSLAARDGLPVGRGLLLWLEYSLAALDAVASMPAAVVDYPALLKDWRAVVARVAGLPGFHSLAPNAAASRKVDAFLDPGRRHQSAACAAPLPAAVASAWQAMQACLAKGEVLPGTAETLRKQLAPLRELLHPVLDDWRMFRRQLWQRVARAEAALADDALRLPPAVQDLSRGIEANRAGLVDAISIELRRMQGIVAQAKVDAALHEQRAEAARSDLAGAVARSQQLSADIIALRYELEQLRDIARQFNQMRQSRSWRWTRPLRALVRLARGEFTASDRVHLRRSLGRKLKGYVAPARAAGEAWGQLVQVIGTDLLPNAEEAAALRLASAQEGLEDVFVWAVVDWHFRFQRPQHIARALAQKGHRVFYISNNFNDSASPGFHIDPLGCEGRLFQVHLNLEGRPPIYFAMPTPTQVEAMRASLAELLAWTCTRASVSLVQHPYWSPLVRAVPSARLVYDCMDHHGGFENNAPAVIEEEARLVEDADLVIVTSSWLEQEIAPRARATAMVRNAGEFALFRDPPAEVFRDPQDRRVIGYHGAIAEWFDLALVRRVAEAEPDALVLLIGNDTAKASEALADLPNVRLTGEVPYAQLPYWLHGFDVCLLPFRVIPLTLATNPVKVYEYLAAGKPVVSVNLPEMAQFDGLVRVAADPAAFVQAVHTALAAPADQGREERQRFAEAQTWAHRAEALDQALATLPEPKVSVIVLTYNNWAFTEACLFSLEAYSSYGNLEVIVVDNASSDGSREWLSDWVAQPSPAGHQRRLILNDDNLGFSAGNNVGLRAATGEVLVLLNNDTYVTPGWVRGLVNHLRADPSLGLLGPVTNNIGNEARIDIHYTDMSEMIVAAGKYTRRHPGRRFPIRTVAFFCVAMRRDAYERVGDMDEDFGVGFFEDDDYCRRTEQAGLSVACAEDVFVHHYLSASFDALEAGRKREFFEQSKAIYEAKWGEWVPHAYREEK